MIEDFKDIKIQQYSERSLMLSWTNKKPAPNFINYQQAFMSFLKTQDDRIQYLTPSFDALLLTFYYGVDIKFKLVQIREYLASFLNTEVKFPSTNVYDVPVCYQDFGLDLEEISDQTDLSVSDIIDIHSQTLYTVYFIGFLPGFLYLGTLDERLKLPRKQTPRPKVEQGSIGIAEQQTGIYPSASPGGWQIVGRTPLSIFDINQEPPSPFIPGDQIRFRPVTKIEFDELLDTNAKTSLWK